jgi:ABC-2 type transport system permease protein
MNVKRIYAIVLRQVYLLRKTPTRLVPYFLWSILDVILWGFISKFFAGVAGGGTFFAAALLGAVILLDFFTRAMQGISTAFFEDVWSRNFLNLFGSPLTLPEYVAGLVISSAATTAIAFAVALLVAALVFGFSLAPLGLAVFAFLVVLTLFGIAFGVFAVAAVLRLGPSAEWMIWPIPAFLAPFMGVFYPLATLPAWLQWVARLLPPSYVFENMRSIISTGTFSSVDLLIASALSLVYIALAYGLLRSAYRYVLRTGLIARYSAENTESL